MIDTKEQYEEWRESIEKFPNLRMWPDDMRAIAETIEALREVARLGRNVEQQWREFLLLSEVEGQFQEALDALPDWILE